MNEIIPVIKLQLRESRLSPKGRPVHSLNVSGELINDILNSSDEKTDLRTDWSSLTPESFGGVKLSSHDRRKL
jgi:hypothetical protein